MLKPCLVLLTTLTFSFPAMAATKPTDQVNILNMQISTDGTQDSEKIYAKAWSAIKLDNKTRNKINAINAELDKDGVERFRLIWIRLVNDDIQTVMFQGNRSTVWVYDMHETMEGRNKCYATVDGNGLMSGCQ